jgi:GntR family transcriptional regulator
VARAYRELEIRGVLDTQQGTGTFVSNQPVQQDEVERERRLAQIVGDFIARAGAAGFTINDLLERLQERTNGSEKKRR